MAEFSWVEYTPQSGIRQDVPEFVPHYSKLVNLRWDSLGWRRDWGSSWRAAVTTITTERCTNALHAHFTGGGNTLLVAVLAGTTTSLYTFEGATILDEDSADLLDEIDDPLIEGDGWTKNARTLAGTTYPDLLMFADEMMIMNGSEMLRLNSSDTITTATTAPLGSFGTVHANRLVVAGVSNAKHIFYPSGVRDPSAFTLANGVVVTTTRGEELRNLGSLGKLMIAQTDAATIAYLLSSNNPRDWDRRDVSSLVGCVGHRAYIEVDRGRGTDSHNYAFFWSHQGPYMLVNSGTAAPFMVDLWPPVDKWARGIDFKGLTGLSPNTFANFTAIYVPEFDEVRWGSRSAVTVGQNDQMVCVNVGSAIRYAQGELDAPWWRLRTWDGSTTTPTDPPFESMCVVRVDANNNPANIGRDTSWGFGRSARELDKPGLYRDSEASDGDTPILFNLTRPGHASVDVRDGLWQTKIPRRFELVASIATGSPTVTVVLQRHGGAQASQAQALSLLVSGADEGDSHVFREDFGQIEGKIIDLTISGGTTINSDFHIDGWRIDGLIEERR